MIFITVKFKVRPEYADDWLTLVDPFTQATRKEPGNLWFDWSRSIDDPNEFVLVEAFRDGQAGERHVKSDHFQQAIEAMPVSRWSRRRRSSTSRSRVTTGREWANSRCRRAADRAD
jgi:quinol monooxygenase YgiN